MSPQSSKTLVLAAGVLMFVGVWGARGRISDPFRKTWAAGVVVLGLSALADIAPEVAGPAAILVTMAVYWKHRDVIRLPAGTVGSTAQSVASQFAPGGSGSSIAGGSQIPSSTVGPQTKVKGG